MSLVSTSPWSTADEVWGADQHRAAAGQVNVLADEQRGDGLTVIVVAISTDRTDDVRRTLLSADHGRLVTLTVGEGPHQALLTDADDALSAAIAVRELDPSQRQEPRDRPRSDGASAIRSIPRLVLGPSANYHDL